MKKHSIIWLALFSTVLLTGCNNGGANSSTSEPESNLTSKEVVFYVLSSSLKDKATLYFNKSGASDLPYFKIDKETLSLIGSSLGYGVGASLSVSTEGEKTTITTPKGDSAVIDFAAKTVVYSNYDSFNNHLYSSTPLDPLAASGFDAQGQPAYFERENGSFYLAGENEARKFDLGAYDIPLMFEDGVGYMPLATFGDLFIGPLSAGLAYNGEAVYYYGDFDAVKDTYYSPKATGKVSDELAAFNYHELCFCFDNSYGLFKKRGLTSFDDYFSRLGYKNDMLSSDTLTSETASCKAMFQGFSELHSGFTAASAYTGQTFSPLNSNFFGPSVAQSFKSGSEFRAARKQLLGETYKPYDEIGDTAFVTFDQFLSNTADYYATPASEETAGNDTLALVEYAHKKINEDNIKNVVVDLSCNGGGAVDAAIYIGAWMIGTSSVNIWDTGTGAKGTTLYKADVNMDHKFDDSDTLAGKKIYCLISPVSFSCGNLLPFMLNRAGNVTLVGQTTGGGACMVQKLNSAIGATGQFSGHNVICDLKNGMYSDVDGGINPNYWLNDKASFYDRTKLSAYLKTLL